jgi:hypothetical protein
LEILLSVCHVTLPAENIPRLRTLLAQPLDWPRLLTTSADHALFPLLFWHLNEVAADVTPTPWLDFLRDLFRQNAHRNLHLASALLNLLAPLEAAGIRAVPYKGPVLASAAYGHLGLRTFQDLDLLVRQRDLFYAEGIFQSLGYKPVSAPAKVSPPDSLRFPGQYGYFRETDKVLLEVHTENTLRYFSRQPDFGALWERLDAAVLAGKPVATLSAPDLFSFLAVHGTKHLWDRLSWLCDVAELARKLDPSAWSLVRKRAVEFGVERIVALTLALAHEVLGAPLPADAAAWVRTDATLVNHARHLREWLFAPEKRPGAFGRFLFRVQMQPRWRDGLRYAFRLALTPTEEDVATPSGPPRRALLDPARRLVRLSRKYGLGFRSPARQTISGYEPTPPELVDEMLAFAELRAGDVLYDLGCGDGRIVIQAARRYAIRAVGIELDSALLAQARDAARRHSVEHLVTFLRRDAREVDLSAATVVTLYLPWTANLRLRDMLRRKLRPGTRLVSRNTAMGDWPPDKTQSVRDATGAPGSLFLWRI